MHVAGYSDVAAEENARDETTGQQWWEEFPFRMAQMLLLNENGWISFLSLLQLWGLIK